MGIVGAAVIGVWSFGLIRSAAAVLLDTVPDQGLAEAVRGRLETGGDRVTDLHLWRVGPGHLAMIAAIVSDTVRSPEECKARLSGIEGLSHVTIEVHQCRDHLPIAA
jgi:Co/Zn/Cd efflux system component